MTAMVSLRWWQERVVKPPHIMVYTGSRELWPPPAAYIRQPGPLPKVSMPSQNTTGEQILKMSPNISDSNSNILIAPKTHHFFFYNKMHLVQLQEHSISSKSPNLDSLLRLPAVCQLCLVKQNVTDFSCVMSHSTHYIQKGSVETQRSGWTAAWEDSLHPVAQWLHAGHLTPMALSFAPTQLLPRLGFPHYRQLSFVGISFSCPFQHPDVSIKIYASSYRLYAWPS